MYRIDHFLGKDTVQSILAVRFANALFEPVWRREYIDHVQITAAETIGVEGRGRFYEQTGAFRDMVPNHLFQLLGMIAMEPPNSFSAKSVRDKKAEIFDAIQPLSARDVVFGQYEAGPAGPGYRQEPDVAPDSRTETYAAARVHIDNWRWAGVPFYLRTGKRLAARRTELSVQLKTVPFRLFRDTPVDRLTPNVLTLRIDPAHGTTFDFNVKVPGPVMQVGAVQSSFNYGDFFAERANVGYETLLYDCMLGDERSFSAPTASRRPGRPLIRCCIRRGRRSTCMGIRRAAKARPKPTHCSPPTAAHGGRSATVARKARSNSMGRTNTIGGRDTVATRKTKVKSNANRERILAIDVGGTGLKAAIIERRRADENRPAARGDAVAVHAGHTRRCTRGAGRAASRAAADAHVDGFPGVVRNNRICRRRISAMSDWHDMPLADTIGGRLGDLPCA